MSRTRGFTLIELVIVIAVLAILASIAIPAYTEQVRKGRRADAHSTLGQLQLAMERWRAERPSYAKGGLANWPGDSLPTSDYYTFTIPTATATTFTVQAQPKGAQADDSCGTLSIRYDPADPDGDNDPVDYLPATDGCW